MDTAFTARNLAKWMAKSIIAMKVTDLTRDLVEDYTQFERDSIAVRIGSGAIGWYVSSKLEPVTDAVVDRTADFIAEKRAEHTSKKETEKHKQ